MTKQQLIKKAEKIIALLKELETNCEEVCDNTPYNCTRKQFIYNEVCNSVRKVSKEASENLHNTLDYYCNYEEGYEWTK